MKSSPPVSPKRGWRAIARALAVGILAASAVATPVVAQKLDKPRREWLARHRLLLVPEELAALQQIKDSADLAEFERIFWARRDPAGSLSANPVKAAVERARAAADSRFGESGRKGSETGCGQVFLLLGDADEVIGLGVRETFDTRPTRIPSATRGGDPTTRDPTIQSAAKDGARRAETWIYKGRSARVFKLPGGDLRIAFDDGCQFDENPRTMEELSRVAATRIVHPEIRYEFAANGRLRPAVAPPSQAAGVLDQPRADFEASFEVKVQVPAPAGGYVAGTLRGAAGAIPSGQAASGAAVALDLAARAVPSSGKPIDIAPRRTQAVVDADGAFLTSFGLPLPPGSYELSLAVVEPVSGRATIARAPLDVPNYGAGRFIVGPLMVLTGPDETAAATGVDPYAALAVGSEHLYARAGNVLTPADSLRLLLLVHNAAIAPDTKKASLRASFAILKGGRSVAKGADQVFDTPGAAASVGPIPLTDFAPGQYLARVEVNDDVAKTRVVRETAFTVKAGDVR